jgi:tetratricopeptide (TPR) repeat protein
MEDGVERSEFGAALARTIPLIKTRVQLSALVGTVVALLVLRVTTPENVPAQVCAGMIGICVIAFTLVFNFLNLFEAKDRPRVILTMFVVFSLLVLALVVVTGYLILIEHARKSSEDEQLKALSAIVENVKSGLDAKEASLRSHLRDIGQKKKMEAAALTFTEWKALQDEEALTVSQLQTIEGRKAKVDDIKTQASAIVVEIGRISQDRPSEMSEGIKRQAMDAQAALASGDLTKAQELFQSLANKGTQQTAEAFFWLGRVSELKGEYTEARESYQRAVELDLGNTKYAQALASCEMALGNLSQARSYYERLTTLFRSNPADRTQLVICLSNAATASRFSGDNSTAARYYQEALDISQKFEGTDEVAHASVSNDFAAYYVSIGQYERANELYNISLQIYRRRDDKLSYGYADTLNNLGRLQMLLGRYGSAEAFLKEALDLERETVGTNAALYAISTANLADVYSEWGNTEEAELRFLSALGIVERILGKQHSRYGRILGLYAELLLSMKQLEKANQVASQSKDNLIENFGPDHPFVAEAFARLAEVFIEQSKIDDAVELVRQAENIAKKSADTNRLLLVRIVRDKGVIEDISGHAEPAESLFTNAIGAQEKMLGEFHPELAKTYLAYANHLIHAGNVAAARKFINKASVIASAAFLPEHPIFVMLADKRRAM